MRENCLAAIPLPVPAVKISATSTGCRPTTRAPVLRNGKRPRRRVLAYAMAGAGYRHMGEDTQRLRKVKNPGGSRFGNIPYLKILVAAIVILLVVLLFLQLTGNLPIS